MTFHDRVVRIDWSAPPRRAVRREKLEAAVRAWLDLPGDHLLTIRPAGVDWLWGAEVERILAVMTDDELAQCLAEPAPLAARNLEDVLEEEAGRPTDGTIRRGRVGLAVTGRRIDCPAPGKRGERPAFGFGPVVEPLIADTASLVAIGLFLANAAVWGGLLAGAL
ncbi:MAG TPA: hypothetical protein PLJ34_11270 [Hyphomicrobiales bacterium]|nr:hypothetical protein [Hyphomicrobiales bacterium]